MDVCTECSTGTPAEMALCLKGTTCTEDQTNCPACSDMATVIDYDAALTTYFTSEESCILSECTVGCDLCDNWANTQNPNAGLGSNLFRSMTECLALVHPQFNFGEQCRVVEDCATDCSMWDVTVDPNSDSVTGFTDIVGGLTAEQQCHLQKCPRTACVESANFAAIDDPLTGTAFADQPTMQEDLSVCGSERCSECDENWDKSFERVFNSAAQCKKAMCFGVCSDCAANYATAFEQAYFDQADCETNECNTCARCTEEDRSLFFLADYETLEKCQVTYCLTDDCSVLCADFDQKINTHNNWFYASED